MSRNIGTKIGSPQDPESGLEAVVALKRLAEMLEAAHVENAYKAGWSWTEIAEILGVSKQALHKKHAERLRVKLADANSQGGEGY